MADFRYAQLCPLARAAEVVGERWTLLVLRELVLGPKRFSDLLGPLAGVSTSVLADRLARLEGRGVVARRELPPPAAATVYELTGLGRGLLPALLELARWGARLHSPPRAGDHFEPAWLRLGLMAFARRSPSPALRFNLLPSEGGEEVAFHVAGGPRGTLVTGEPAEAELSLRGAATALFALAAGRLDPGQALRRGIVDAEGDAEALVDFPALFEMEPPPGKGDPACPSSTE